MLKKEIALGIAIIVFCSIYALLVWLKAGYVSRDVWTEIICICNIYIIIMFCKYATLPLMHRLIPKRKRKDWMIYCTFALTLLVFLILGAKLVNLIFD